MQNVYLYTKNDTEVELLTELIKEYKYDERFSVTENRRSNILYREIQKQIQPSDTLVVMSLDTLAADIETLYQELLWLKDHEINLIVHEFTATHTSETVLLEVALNTMIDVYCKMTGSTTSRSPVLLSKSKGGRKSIQYPDNWDELYEKWSAKQITALEFMKCSGLKKGTFYHMLSDYKCMLAKNENSSIISLSNENQVS